MPVKKKDALGISCYGHNDMLYQITKYKLDKFQSKVVTFSRNM